MQSVKGEEKDGKLTGDQIGPLVEKYEKVREVKAGNDNRDYHVIHSLSCLLPY